MTDQKQKKEAPKPGDIVGEKDGFICVVHPVTPEQKKELRKKGKILDAKFM